MELPDFAARVADLRHRKQVIVGDDAVCNLVRHGGAGLVWLTTDLNGTKSRRIQRLCGKYDVPCLVGGTSDDLSDVTGCENSRVYGLRRGCPGLRSILMDLPE